MWLFFDSETTGIPRNFNAPATDVRNWPRMVQLAWLQMDAKGRRLQAAEHIIKPEGFTIPADVVRIHGITTARALKEGVPLNEVLKSFATVVSESKLLIAHNMDFDAKIVGAEFHRAGIEHGIERLRQFCTMKGSKDYCRLPGKYGFKWPTLAELHLHLFGTGLAESHTAAADVETCAKCFVELRKRKAIRC